MTIIAENVTVKFPHITLTGDIHQEKHHGGETALVLMTDEGPETLTISLGADAPYTLGEDEVFIKNYSEHQGLGDALEEAGIVTLTGKTSTGPFGAEVYIAEIVKK